MISRAVKCAWKKVGVRRFTYHNYPNTALTEWVRQNINVDIAMRVSGHTGGQMHKFYVGVRAEASRMRFGPG